VSVETEQEPTRIEAPLNPLLSILVTLAAHGQKVDYSLDVFNLPRDLYDELPGEREHSWVARETRNWCKVTELADVKLTLYTVEPPAKDVA
jgi:hypothetical protein